MRSGTVFGADDFAQHAAAHCLHERGFMESFLFLREKLPDLQDQLTPAAFLELLVRNGRRAKNPPPSTIAVMSERMICAGGWLSNVCSRHITADRFLMLLTAKGSQKLAKLIGIGADLVILDEKLSALLFCSRDAMRVLEGRIGSQIVAYVSFANDSLPSPIFGDGRLFLQPKWIAQHGFSGFAAPTFECSVFAAPQPVGVDELCTASSRIGRGPDRWAGYVVWSRG